MGATVVVTVTDLPPNTPVRTVPRCDPAPRGRRPGPALVILSSAALFGVTFAFLAYQLSVGKDPSLSAAAESRPIVMRQVVKRRVITTIVPTPGRSTVTSSGQPVGSPTSSGYAPIITSAS